MRRMATRYPKEQMHRIKYTPLTPQQIQAKLTANTGPVSASPVSDRLAGKTFAIVMDDGPTLQYRFTDKSRLAFGELPTATSLVESVAAPYAAQALDNITLFTHLVPRSQRG